MKRIRLILTVSIGLITFLLGVIFYQIKTHPYPVNEFYCQIPVPFCGTSNPDLTEDGIKGKEIFNSNCAACHKLDAKSTGPALRNVDSLVFVKWIINKNYKIDSTKIEKLGIEFHRAKFIDHVTTKDLTLIIAYCSSSRY
ncbi:c-type cytochrome [Flavobacterium artemisiae]|uniref:C-type cytochrome n=1 Tax=Flavobacterium artemisiae TaxID=2126556 RepID=A0ABW4H9R3_9FLAO